MNKTITWVLIGLLSAILLAVILIIVLGDRETSLKVEVPEKIDVVLVDRSRGRLGFQIENIDNYMPWINSIVVIKMTKVEHKLPNIEKKGDQKQQKEGNPVITMSTDYTDLLQVFEHIKEIVPELSDDFLFLGDTTFPVQKIVPTQLYSPSKKIRMFNHLDIDAKHAGFEKYFEDTMPCLLVHVEDLVQAGSLDYYLLSQSITNQIVYSPFINQTVVLTDNEFADNEQLDTKPTAVHLFRTFIIAPTLTERAKQRMNQKTIDQLFMA